MPRFCSSSKGRPLYIHVEVTRVSCLFREIVRRRDSCNLVDRSNGNTSTAAEVSCIGPILRQNHVNLIVGGLVLTHAEILLCGLT